MKFLISGSSGFIGSRFMELYGDAEVVDLHYKTLSDIKGLSMDVDYIFHLAAYGNMSYHDDDRQIIKSNIDYLYNLLEATKDIDYKGFVNVSSSSVQLKHSTMYSATKRAGEEICKAFANKHDKPIVSVRPFSVYGPGDNKKHFIPVIVDKLENGGTLSISRGTHDWIYVDDIVNAMWKLAHVAKEHKGEVFGLGTGVKTDNFDLVNKIKTLWSKPLNVSMVSRMRDYDTSGWYCRDKSIYKAIDWEPRSLVDGLVEYAKSLKTSI